MRRRAKLEGKPRRPKVERTSVAKWPQGAAIRRLISWRRSEATTSPATRLKPSFQGLRQSRSKSSAASAASKIKKNRASA